MTYNAENIDTELIFCTTRRREYVAKIEASNKKTDHLRLGRTTD